jgi:hypothetical protein
MFQRTEQESSDSETMRIPGGQSQGAWYDKEVVTAEVGQPMELKPHNKVTIGDSLPHGTPEIEEKSRLSEELAGEIMGALDAGMRIDIPGWGYHRIRLLGVRRIIDQYYDTPDRMFRTWSKANEETLLLRERHEGIVIGGLPPQDMFTRENMAMLPVESETHVWLVKVPLEGVPSNVGVRKAREIVTPYTNQERETGKRQQIRVLQQALHMELDPLTVDVREYVVKVRKTYGIFSEPTSHDPETCVAKIDLDFIVRTYNRPDGTSIERYAKYEVEKQGENTISQFEACTLALRTLLHLPKEEPPSRPMEELR